MRKTIATISAASEPADRTELLEDRMDQIQADFDYLMDGISYLIASSDIDSATSLLNAVEESINSTITEAADMIAS